MPRQFHSVVLSDYSLRPVSLSAFLMPPKVLNKSTHAQQSSPAVVEGPADRASILIFISAHALGSLGFAVSLFAIWFGWLLPAALTAPSAAASTTPSGAQDDSSEIKKPNNSRPRSTFKQPRRSTPNDHAVTVVPIPIRRASAPVTITPILVPRPEDVQNNSRRVYFEDSAPPTVIRRNTMPEPELVSVGLVPKSEVTSVPSSANNSRSASPVPMISGAQLEVTEDGALDSDCSPHSSKASLHMQSCLQKFKRRKPNRSETQDKQADQASIASTETSASVKASRRTSGGFVAPWALTRHRTAPDVTASDSGSSSPSRLSFTRRKSPARPSTNPAGNAASSTMASAAPEILSPTFLSRKSQKRVSAPIPRTSPYGAPYFAAPPLLLNNNAASAKNYHDYLKGLPQFEDETQAPPSPDVEGSRGRTSSIRRVNLGVSSDTLPKRRSASEDWTQRPDAKRS